MVTTTILRSSRRQSYEQTNDNNTKDSDIDNRRSSQESDPLRPTRIVTIVVIFSVITLGSILKLPSTNANKTLQKKKRSPRKKLSGSYQSLTNEEKIDLIATAKVNLIDIVIPSRSLLPELETYDGVKGIFCPLNWRVYKRKPSSFPMFKDLVKKSQCQDPFKIDLKYAVEKLKEYDRKVSFGNHTPNFHDEEKEMSQKQQQQNTVPLSGLVFHESRCGSTLVANTLTAMNPELNRVYSESSPPITALKSCDNGRDRGDYPCDENTAIELLRDVVFLMGRKNPDTSKEINLFFKIQSIGSRYIPLARKAFPDTKWIFVYREPVQVMMSHLKNLKTKKMVNCLRSLHGPYHKTLRKVLKSHKRDVDSLSREEFCAAHLASLCMSALQEFESDENRMGMMVNYEQIPDILITSVFPDHFNLNVDADEEERIRNECGSYSKGRTSKPKSWEEDSETKESRASDEVKDASALFLLPVYNKLKGTSTI